MKRITKTLALIISMAMVMIMLPVTAMADGSYSVDNTYLTLNVGETATVTIVADNAAGRVDWSGSGAVSSSGSAYLDNGEATISITAESAGTGYVNVVPTDIATYDGEEITYGYTIQVDVAGQNGGADNNSADTADNNVNDAAPQEDAGDVEDAPAEVQNTPDDNDNVQENANEDTQEPENREPAAAGKALTDSNKDYADLDEDSRLYTNVDDQELYIIQFPRWLNDDNEVVWNDEVYGLDLLEGFDLVTVNYKDMDVDTFQYKDMLNVFVLKNFETDQSNYYLLEDGVGFTQLKYITANGKQYIVVDYPSDFVIPSGSQMVELTFGNTTVQALKRVSDGSGSTLKGYETEVSPGLDTADPTDDIYYIYCLVDGKTQLYSYDSGENTLQRASLVVYKEIPTEPETVIVYETVPAEESTEDDSTLLKGIGWNGMQVQVKILLIALAAAILLIIILIIMFAAMSKKNKKNNKNNKNNKSNTKNNNKNMNKKQSGNKKSKDDIPERTTGRSKNDDVEESFFSYVKTEKDSYDLDDLNL